MSLSVMIVEDDPVTALDLKNLLEDAGHKVVGQAASFDEAVALAHRKTPRVALIDMDLKGQRNGLDVAEALGLELGILPLFVTGTHDFAVRAMALPVEPIGYIDKPYKAEDILDALSVVA